MPEHRSPGPASGEFDTFLFDVDGTLIDSNGAHATAWAEALREHGVNAELEDVRRLIGMGGDKLLPLIAHVAEDSKLGKAIAQRKKEVFATRLPVLRPTRGARALLEYLDGQGADLVIATSADDKELTALLVQAGVDNLFSKRTSKDDAEESKPDPDIIQAALRRAKASPERTVMIGDTPYDIEAAQRAGVRTIALRCGGYWTDSALSAAIGIYDDPLDCLRAFTALPCTG
jgi:HAD superfamily hydrolase (TIGR01509 family)